MFALHLTVFALLATQVVSGSSYEYVVDLGYQLNQGHVVNDTLVTFRNVRYAAAPLGSLRFNAAASPPINRTAVQNASDVICPQAYPSWLLYGAVTPVTAANISAVDPRTSEDCLFLDVLMPQGIWSNRWTRRAPVIVWIHGGGLTVGYKDASGAGYGLVSRSEAYGREGVILVSVNYRLGLFGWMNGEEVTSNEGLRDQRFALEWVQEYISLFGGDPDNVTIIGESSGGSSVEAHLTAYGGAYPSPFKGAIAQSPYLIPTDPYPNTYVDAIVKYGNVSSITALRKMATADLQILNALVVGNTPIFGTFTFDIAVDGDYVPDLPSKLLQEGRFDHSIAVLTGHNQDEGSRFVPSTLITNETTYEDFVETLIPALSKDSVELAQISKTLYPPIFNDSEGYKNETERSNLTFADAVIVCNARSMDTASFIPQTYAYVFSVPPALHGADLSYTFYDFGAVDGVNTTLAVIMQQYITQFAVTGSPNGHGLPHFAPATGLTIQKLGSNFVGPIQDEMGIKQLSTRCEYWQDSPYLSNCD